MYNINTFLIGIYIYTHHTEWQDLKNKSKCTTFTSSRGFHSTEKVIPKIHDIFYSQERVFIVRFLFCISPNQKKDNKQTRKVIYS